MGGLEPPTHGLRVQSLDENKAQEAALPLFFIKVDLDIFFIVTNALFKF